MRLAAVLGLPYSLMTHGYDIFQSPRNLREKHERAAFAASACDYSARGLRGRLGGRASRGWSRAWIASAFSAGRPIAGGRAS